MTSDDFRRLALDLPGATEHAHMGHPDFRANGRIFASMHSRDRFGMVKVAPEEQRALLRAHGPMFESSSGAWGRQGCTNVHLAVATTAVVRGALLLAWQLAASKPAAKKSSRRRTVSAGPRSQG